MKSARATSVFAFEDYRQFLLAYLSELETQERGQKTLLSLAMNCQPAYLSRILKGDADLSFEQIEAASRFFVLNRSESDYLIALLGEARSGTKQLKAYWSQLKKKAQLDQKELKNRLNLEDSLSEEEILTYYSSWHFAAVHIGTSIPHLQTVTALARYLSLSPDAIRSALDFLCRAGLVIKKDQKFMTSERNIHLGRGHPMVTRHHINWKLKAIESLTRPEVENLRYTGIVTLSRKDIEKLKDVILSAVEEIRSVVKDSPEETLGCYQMDFFELGASSD